VERDYGIDAPNLALTAATTLYVIGAITSANTPVDLIEMTYGGDSQAAGSLKIELVTWTTDGTGTGYTPKPFNGDGQMVACVTTAKINYTVAPSGTITVIKTWDTAVPIGPFDLQLPLGREFTMLISTKFGFRFTSITASFNGYAHLIIEE
jgi:hypothetical protein